DADFWANRLLLAATTIGSGERPDQLMAMMADLAAARPHPSPHFSERLTSQLQGEGSAMVVAVQSWIERRLGEPLPDIVRREQTPRGAEQLTIPNIIPSLPRLLDWDWRKIFEECSHIHHALCADPAGVYGAMDFTTRDRYRHAIEDIA